MSSGSGQPWQDVDKLLIIGVANRVWSDLYWNDLDKWDGEIMCFKDIGMYYPRPFSYWYINHADNVPAMLQIRNEKYGDSRGIQTFSSEHRGNHIVFSNGSQAAAHAGSGALSAVILGDSLGFAEIALAGLPMNAGPCFYEPASNNRIGQRGSGTAKDEESWRRVIPTLNAKVTSFSGNTKRWLTEMNI